MRGRVHEARCVLALSQGATATSGLVALSAVDAEQDAALGHVGVGEVELLSARDRGAGGQGSHPRGHGGDLLVGVDDFLARRLRTRCSHGHAARSDLEVNRCCTDSDQ